MIHAAIPAPATFHHVPAAFIVPCSLLECLQSGFIMPQVRLNVRGFPVAHVSLVCPSKSSGPAPTVGESARLLGALGFRRCHSLDEGIHPMPNTPEAALRAPCTDLGDVDSGLTPVQGWVEGLQGRV